MPHPSSLATIMTLQEILNLLYAHRVRATYGAVATALNVDYDRIGNLLGQPTVRTALVVGQKTDAPLIPHPVDVWGDVAVQGAYKNPPILSTAEEIRNLIGLTKPVWNDPVKKTPPPPPVYDFCNNEPVKLTGGPFESMEGVIVDANKPRGPAKISLTVFGRATVVDVPYAFLQKTEGN